MDETEDGADEEQHNAFSAALTAAAAALSDQDSGSDSFTVFRVVLDRITSSSLREIDLAGFEDFRLNDQHIGSLVEALYTAGVRPTKLSLKYHHIGDTGVEDICSLLMDRSSELTQLNLEGNEIGVGGAASLKDALSFPGCILSDLNISWNLLTPEGGLKLAEGLEANSSLRTLKANNCGFNYGAIVALCTGIKLHPALRDIELDRPVLGKFDSDICVDHMSVALLNHRTVEGLSMRYFNISDHGISLLSQSLCSDIALRFLNVSSNSIGTKGAEYLASFIVQSKTIRTVILSNNDIRDEGALALSKAVMVSPSINKLHVQNNNIRDSGLLAIGESLKKNRTLHELKLWGNHFTDQSATLYWQLSKTRFPVTGLALDFSVYVVDGVHLVAATSN